MLTADVLGWIEAEKAQLWIGGNPVDAVCITELIEYPRERACRLIFAAGEIGRVLEGQELVEAWARSQGCASIEIEGRRGWERMAPGFAFESALLRRRL